MSDEENYFDKFTADLEKRENDKKLKIDALREAEENWKMRRELASKYREHPLQRTRVQR